jgi:hypothetical protein
LGDHRLVLRLLGEPEAFLEQGCRLLVVGLMQGDDAKVGQVVAGRPDGPDRAGQGQGLFK